MKILKVFLLLIIFKTGLFAQNIGFIGFKPNFNDTEENKKYRIIIENNIYNEISSSLNSVIPKEKLLTNRNIDLISTEIQNYFIKLNNNTTILEIIKLYQCNFFIIGLININDKTDMQNSQSINEPNKEFIVSIKIFNNQNDEILFRTVKINSISKINIETVEFAKQIIYDFKAKMQKR